MVRQRPRKAFEELYGSSKLETAKSQVGTTSVNKSMRTERELGGYLIQSNTPFTAMTLPPGVALSSALNTSTLPSSRRKSVGTARMIPNRTNGVLTSHYATEEIKKDSTSSKNKAISNCRQEKGSVYSGTGLCENKNFSTYEGHAHMQAPVKDLQQSTRAHSHHHHHHHHPQHPQQPQRPLAGRDDEKEDDADEFFDVIKNTVQNAVGKAISDLLNRNFRDLSAKIDKFSKELKTTNTLLNKLQMDINNKVVHYGEENSRHFRYLCMKSEYDKMFYQHQGMGNLNETSVNAPKQKTSRGTLDASVEHQEAPCTCRPSSASSSNLKIQQGSQMPHKGGSDEVSIGQKSSSVDVRDVIEHIQRFCTQIQMTGMLDNRHSQPREQTYRNMDPLEAINLHKKVFEEDDDDESQMSSDGMTPRSEHPYGANTMRSARLSNGIANMGDGDN